MNDSIKDFLKWFNRQFSSRDDMVDFFIDKSCTLEELVNLYRAGGTIAKRTELTPKTTYIMLYPEE